MKRVPKLSPCPACGVELEAGDGPHKLAWHGCSPRALEVDPASVMEMVEQAITKPDLTMQEAGLCYARMVLHRLSRNPEAGIGDPGSIFEGMAKFITSKDAAPEGSDLKAFLAALAAEPSP